MALSIIATQARVHTLHHVVEVLELGPSEVIFHDTQQQTKLAAQPPDHHTSLSMISRRNCKSRAKWNTCRFYNNLLTDQRHCAL